MARSLISIKEKYPLRVRCASFACFAVKIKEQANLIGTG